MAEVRAEVRTDVRTVAVIGAGIMGRGIAHAAALGGYRTILEDLLPNALRKAETEIRTNLDKAVELGKVNATDAGHALPDIGIPPRVGDGEDVARDPRPPVGPEVGGVPGWSSAEGSLHRRGRERDGATADVIEQVADGVTLARRGPRERVVRNGFDNSSHPPCRGSEIELCRHVQ